MSESNCIACGHSIDAAARICPYCGANPVTGEKADTQAMLREVFQPRDVTTSSTIMTYARERQGIVVALGVIIVFLILAGLHQLVTARNAAQTAGEPAVPLTEITDISDQSRPSQPSPMPALQFAFDGKAQSMRTFIVEPGAVTPPEVIAAQQAVAQQAAAQRAAAALAAAGKTGVAPRAGVAPPGAPATTPAPQPLPSAQPQRH